MFLLAVAIIVGLIIDGTGPSFAAALIAGSLVSRCIFFLNGACDLSADIFNAPVPEIAVGGAPQREISIRMDDLLIIVISLGWLARSAFYKDLGLFIKTPLNKVILSYVTNVFWQPCSVWSLGR